MSTCFYVVKVGLDSPPVQIPSSMPIILKPVLQMHENLQNAFVFCYL